ncbi:MAG: AraC family transcriptional regulator, partial [Synechococcus sp. NAT40]|nr:AraC family transcriptional regulator [Synechococcus sp. NAT40]
DFDLRLPAGSRLCTLVIAKDELLKRHPQQRGSLTLQRWQNTNQLELRADHAKQLRDQIETLIKQEGKTTDPSTAERLLSAVINCFENEEAETRAIKKRQARHTAAIEVLHWCHTNPCQSITVDDLSELLYQSRTSLFKGCKEHFNRTPLEVQRAVRLDGVREFLLKPNKRAQLDLKDIKQVAQHFDFASPDHFKRRFREAFGEQPQQTIQGNHPEGAK